MWSHNPALWTLFVLAFAAGLTGLILAITWKPEEIGLRYVLPHEAKRWLRVRLATPIWWALPGSIQGRLCDCPICRGKEQADG